MSLEERWGPMKTIALIFVLIFALAAPTFGSRTHSAVRTSIADPQAIRILDVSYFYDELSPYGRWFQVDEYGWVWSPKAMSYDWRPYTNGYWVWTDWGWTWVSEW